jgi:molecular chaperone DnaK
MKLGVDFGTTRIVVAAADRGNYPVIGFEAPEGQTIDWIPPLAAIRGGEQRFGWDAWALIGDPDWTIVRSLKRLLRRAGPGTEVQAGDSVIALQQLLVKLLGTLRRELRSRSTLQFDRGEPLEVMLGVPANANSNQRFLTAEAFREAGFHVLGVLNEPSAASVEFGHRDRAARKGQAARSLLVYDLGGGTFDASLVELHEEIHSVIASTGISDLGGDDFDEILADLALETAGIGEADREMLSTAELFRLYDECRERKESLNPNTRRLVVDLDRVRAGWGEVSIAAAAFYERCRPLIERTEVMVEELLAAHPNHALHTLYVTGGGSELPAVSRVLREVFGRRVRNSAYMRSATAIGLAVYADTRSGYVLRDRFAQNFGVWREADYGSNISFDLLFPRGLEMPRPGAEAVRIVRAYRPAHNVGHFRFVECSQLGDDGQPVGDLSAWDDVFFPFDPSLRDDPDLSGVPVARFRGTSDHLIEEEYLYDASGMVKVRISNKSEGYSREFALGKWSAKSSRVAAARKVSGKTAHRRQ